MWIILGIIFAGLLYIFYNPYWLDFGKGTTYEQLQACDNKTDLNAKLAINDVPAWAVTKANQYLIKRLGEKYVNCNVVVDPSETKYWGGYGQDKEWYRVSYIHTIFTNLLGTDKRKVTLVVDIDLQGNNVSLIGNGTVPNCNNYPALCSIKVDKNGAFDLASRRGFNFSSKDSYYDIRLISDPNEPNGKGWEWFFHDESACGSVFRPENVEINITTGKIRTGLGLLCSRR